MGSLRRLALGLVALALLAGFAPPPAPDHWVTDTAHVLSPAVQERLDQRLQSFERSTGHQVVVWIGRTTGGVPPEEWAATTFKAWGIGSRKLDDGLAVFLFMDDRQIRIEVGYGLEPVVPDAIASRIIRDDAIPRLKAGDVDGATSAVVDDLLQQIGGESPGSGGATQPGSTPQVPLTVPQMIAFGLFALILLIVLITHPTLALFLFSTIFRGGRGRSGGSGGGFSGGGGRSGGGGAGGSW